MASRKPDPYTIDDATAPLTDAEVKALRPAADALGELGVAVPKRRGRPAGATKEQVTVRIDKDVLAAIRGDNPRGWQTRLNAVLREHFMPGHNRTE